MCRGMVNDRRFDRHDRQWLGREGEARAARHLEGRGYRIVARNVRADRVEIDLIACRGSTLVFVEVKTRRRSLGGVHHGLAAEAVDPRKQRRLRRGARAWLADNRREARRASRCRFDVVTCLLEEDRQPAPPTDRPATRWSIEHWEAAF